MPTIDLHKGPFDQGTLTKLEIFERYLESWLPVWINTSACREVNICDFFAGSGQDKNGTPGSPLIILDVINRYHEEIVKKGLKINVLLNEFDKRKYSVLRHVVDNKVFGIKGLQRIVNISCSNKDFQCLFNEIKNKLRDKCNLIFIDQNGVKHVTADRVLELDRFIRTDYLFFSSSSYLKRFGFKKYFPDLKLDPELKQSEIHRELLEYYRSKLPDDSITMLYPFTIKKKGKIYGLIFGTKHPLGADKFLRIVWDQNPLNGEANFDINRDRIKGQLLFWEKPRYTKLDAFKEEIKEFILLNEKITNKEIYFFTLSKGFIPKHAVEVLRELMDDGRLTRFSHLLISYNSAIKNKKIISFQTLKK